MYQSMPIGSWEISTIHSIINIIIRFRDLPLYFIMENIQKVAEQAEQYLVIESLSSCIHGIQYNFTLARLKLWKNFERWLMFHLLCKYL